MKNKKIATIGGGTGSFTLLSGLKKYPLELSAIVTMADDGGSTGILRDELGVLPPGDIRQCLVALSNSTETLRRLMNYRFTQGGLKGHNFGNLLLSALEKINGSFSKGVEEAARLLDIKGQVIPVSEGNMRLHIILKNGKELIGESNLDHSLEIRKFGIERIYLKPKVSAHKKAVEAIKKADFIVIGPGDHFGSIIPNILIEKIAQAIRVTKAKVIYVCNLTNKKGQTDNWSLEDYVSEIESFIGKGRIDYVTFNSRKIPEGLIKKYVKQEGKGALVSLGEKKSKYSFTLICADVVSDKLIRAISGDKNTSSRSFIRHDSDMLAMVLNMIFELADHEHIVKEIIS